MLIVWGVVWGGSFSRSSRPGRTSLGGVIWLGYMLITFNGKPSRQRLSLLLGPAVLFAIGLIFLVMAMSNH